MNTSNNEVSLVRGGDDRITELIKLLQLSATFDDEKVLNIVKESNIQVMLKLRKNRWSKVGLS
jgi:2-C-methyl-D-erythritol 4-phosphate cytidylyltransferase